MTADTGNDAEATKKRGRIPQSAWPHIVDRYRSGATLSAIAREFDCTPSAISYIIRKAEAAGIEPSGFAEAEMDSGNTDNDADDAAGTPASTNGGAPAVPQYRPVTAQPGPGPSVPTPSAVPASAQAPYTPIPHAPAPHTPTPQPAQQTLRLNPPAPPPEPEPPQPAVMRPPVQPSSQLGVQAAGGKAEPTPPVDAVEARLRETARGCLSAYRSWRQAPGETSVQTLSEAVHELRKALARVEIDMSAGRREEQAIRPIPIPVHRSSRRPQ
jgi:hypothetical protein